MSDNGAKTPDEAWGLGVLSGLRREVSREAYSHFMLGLLSYRANEEFWRDVLQSYEQAGEPLTAQQQNVDQRIEGLVEAWADAREAWAKRRAEE